ncbi:MAG: DUF2723 domain-containing protein [Chloroflexi bacterium]|nr:DUF2723 domain-containing protein [Chloroflexota bacterium]
MARGKNLDSTRKKEKKPAPKEDVKSPVYLPSKSKAGIAGAVISFLLPFSIYIFFLCPTIAAGDSGELINCAAFLGIPHPPGYPLFTMLGHIFTWLPVNSIAWRVNLSSAAFCALACLFVYLSLFRLTGRVWASVGGALGLAFSRFFWHYAEVAEVFPLNNLFVALLTYLAVMIKDSVTESGTGRKSGLKASPHTRKMFWLFCLFFGMSLTNHQTIILLFPAFLFFLWFSAPVIFKEWKTFGTGVLIFILGLLPYIYAPISASTGPPVNWDNPTTLRDFKRLVTREDFGSLSLLSKESELRAPTSRLSQVPAFLGTLWQQFTPFGLVLAVLGMLGAYRRKIFQGYLALAFFFGGLFFVVFANMPIQNKLLFGVLHRFYLMPAVILSFWIGLGIENIAVWMEDKKVSRAAAGAVPAALVILLFIWQFASNHEEADFRNNYLAEDFVHNLMMALPQNSLFFVHGDVASMGMDYLQMVQGERPDVITMDQEKLTYEWFYDEMKKRYPDITLRGERYDGVNVFNFHLISDNIQKRPVIFMDFKEESYKQAYRAIPLGLAYMMLPLNTPYSLVQAEETMNRLYSQFQKRGWDRKYPPTSFEYDIIKFYARPYFRLGYEFANEGNDVKAAEYYKKAMEYDPDYYPALKNLAIVYLYKLSRQKEAVELFKRYVKVNPADKDIEKVKQIIKQFGG